MARACTVCSRPDRHAIDKALLAGEPFRGIARRAALSPDAVERHAKAHLPAKLAKASAAREVAEAGSLLEEARDLQRRALAILTQAEKDGDGRTAIAAIREARGNLELLARLLGELKETGSAAVVYVAELRGGRGAVEAVRELPALEAHRGE